MTQILIMASRRSTMKHKRAHPRLAAAGGIFAVILMLTTAAPRLRADDSAAQFQSINMTKGETATIDHLKKASAPTVHVIENPNALVLNGDNPGQLLMVAAERGKWDITVTHDDGDVVVYRVSVAAIADNPDNGNPLKPASAPAALSDNSPPPRQNSTVVNSDATQNVVAPASENVSLRSSQPSLQSTRKWNPAAFANGWASANPPTEPLPRIAGQQDAAEAGRQYRTDPPVASSSAGYFNPSVSSGPNYLPADGLSLMTGTSQIVDFPRRLKRVSIADSSVADIQVTGPYQLNVIAHKFGFTTLAVWDDQGHYQERQVSVENNGKQQVLLNVVVAELDRVKMEQQGIDFSIALANAGISLASLPGSVATPYTATSSLTAGTSSIAGTTPAGGSIIPLLLSSTMTYGLSTLNSNVATQSFFQFLESHNLARILAQPHLLANSGQAASFLSGGEIPIVLAQALNTSIVFKQFGTSINFLPTVIGRQEIQLLVKTEVSEPDFAHGVELFGFTVPAFVTRRADTLVRLKDSQTLIIAGLILRSRNAVVKKVPYLGDLPYAGAIFRNTTWEDSETDLVMAVMPQIVGPLPPQAEVFQPTSRGPLTDAEVRTQRLQTPDAARPRF